MVSFFERSVVLLEMVSQEVYVLCLVVIVMKLLIG